MNGKRNGIIALIVAVILIAAAGIYVTQVYMPDSRYKKAVALKESGDFEGAVSAFEALGEYKDSADQIAECENAIKDAAYADAVVLKDSGDYEAAISALKALDGYKDSADLIAECETAIQDEAYDAAVALKDSGDYEAAISAFEALDGYRDSADQIVECQNLIKDQAYDEAVELKKNGDLAGAITAFEALDGYKDSEKQIVLCRGMLENQVQENFEFGKAYHMELPDESWSVIVDTNGVAVIESEEGRLLVIHKDAASQMIPETAEAAKLMETAWISDEIEQGAEFEIVDYSYEAAEDISVIRYLVSYGDTENADGATQKMVKYVISGADCYQIIAKPLTNDEDVIAKINSSIDTFEITPDDSTAASKISGDQL